MKEKIEDFLQKWLLIAMGVIVLLIVGWRVARIPASVFELARSSTATASVHTPAASPAPASAQQDPGWTTAIVGSYGIQISSGAAVYKGSTTFKLDRYGRIEGQYEYIYRREREAGVLSNCEAEGLRELICAWQDRFGKGILRIEFSEDYSSFDGYWRFDGRKEESSWKGVR